MSLTVTRPRTLTAMGVGIAAALSLAIFTSPWLGHAVREGISKGLQNVETVAAMLAERSPGTRPEGALVQLKHKKQAALHERALPKIRNPYAPPTAYEALAGPPPAPVIETTPLVAMGAPLPETPVIGGSGGGPPFLSDIPLPGGGGGGGFTPPITTTVTPEVPPTPVAPVPEPASWAMMLLGFAMIGRAVRQRKLANG